MHAFSTKILSHFFFFLPFNILMLTSFPKRSFPKKEKKKVIIIFFVLGPTQVHIRAPKMIRKFFYLNLIGFPKKKKKKPN